MCGSCKLLIAENNRRVCSINMNISVCYCAPGSVTAWTAKNKSVYGSSCVKCHNCRSRLHPEKYSLTLQTMIRYHNCIIYSMFQTSFGCYFGQHDPTRTLRNPKPDRDPPHYCTWYVTCGCTGGNLILAHFDPPKNTERMYLAF